MRLTKDIERLSDGISKLIPSMIKPVVDIIWFTAQLYRLTGRRGMAILYLYALGGLAILRVVTPDFGALAKKVRFQNYSLAALPFWGTSFFIFIWLCSSLYSYVINGIYFGVIYAVQGISSMFQVMQDEKKANSHRTGESTPPFTKSHESNVSKHFD